MVQMWIFTMIHGRSVKSLKPKCTVPVDLWGLGFCVEMWFLLEKQIHQHSVSHLL